MKKITFLALFVLLLTASCNKDLGNYNYSTLDSLQLNEFPDTIKIQVGQEVAVVPNIVTNNETFDKQELTFQWYAYNLNVPDKTKARINLGTSSELKLVPKMSVGTYPCYLRITQPSSGRTWTYGFTLIIEGKIGKIGFFILSEKDKQAHLDYFQDDPNNWNSFGTIYRDINLFWNNPVTSQPLSFEGEPRTMEVYATRRDAYSKQITSLFINVGNHSHLVNQSDGFTYDPVTFDFKYLSAGGNPEYADNIIAADALASIAFKDNNIYMYAFGFNKYYNVPLNANPDGSLYPVSPYVAMPLNNNYMYTMIFDNQAKRFMSFYMYDAVAKPVMSEITGFKPSNTGMDLVYLGHTMAFNGQAVAIMKKDNKYFLVRFTFTTMGTILPISILDVTSSLTDVAQATNFALDNKYGYLFYSANDKLYQYDMDAKQLKVAKNLNGKKVSLLKSERILNMHLNSPYSTSINKVRMEPLHYSIILGTYDEGSPNTSGKVEFLHVQGLMGDLIQTIKPMEGFGIVKDVQYTDMVS